MTDVVQADLQGNILCGYGRDYPHALFLFLRVEDPGAARAWLRAHIRQVTTAVPWSQAPAHTLNFAFTHAGLEALGVPSPALEGLSHAFREGMAARSAELGDTGTSDPDNWEPALCGVHVLATVSAREGSVRDARRAELVGRASGAGLAVAEAADADTLPGEREHFGFRDGISQPAIRDPRAGPWRRTASDPEVAPGEFLLGYEDEGGTTPPFPQELGFNGSYMVVRKLEQDVEGFHGFLADEAGPDEKRREWLAAKMLGRWRDGSPLVLSPDGPDPERANDLGWLNEFTYALDPDGFACPIGAHIRRAHPRDALDRDWRFSIRHRIIRRGMPYVAEDGQCGLMFVCYQASLERGFEFVQSQWCREGNAFGLGSDPDPVIGPEGKMTIQGRPPQFVRMRRFVTTRGGDYFFAPGIAGLRYITAGEGPTGALPEGPSGARR